jgi:hypothetical protein
MTVPVIPFYHAFDFLCYGAMGVTTVVMLIVRYVWRRGKSLQEP